MHLLSILLISLLTHFTGAEKPGDPVTVNLLFAGDAMQHQGQLDQALQVGGGKTYNYDDCFTLIAPDVMTADYAVCNLEVPLGGGPSYTGYPCFSAPDTYAAALKKAGFDMFLTANNHCLDRRDKAARRTLRALDDLGMDHIGTYHDKADRDTLVPFLRDIKGIRFGFLNYTYGTNGIEPTEGAEIALIDRQKMAREIKATRDAGAEIVVVAVHWGVEYVLNENRHQRDLAQFLVDQGVDLIIGGHPHVVQPMEVVRNDREDKNVLIVYSLGNFISNMKTRDTRGGALVKVKVVRDENGCARFDSATYDTFFTAKPEGKTDNYRVVPRRMSHLIPASQQGNWNLFDRASSTLFDTYNKGVPREN